MNRTTCRTLILTLSLFTCALWAGSERAHGSEDTSRRSVPTGSPRTMSEAPPPSTSRSQPHGIYPRDRQPRYGYWSKKCIRQRNSSLGSLTHTRDCDNPAYTGGRYPYMPPYGPVPYGPTAPVMIINNYGAPRGR